MVQVLLPWTFHLHLLRQLPNRFEACPRQHLTTFPWGSRGEVVRCLSLYPQEQRYQCQNCNYSCSSHHPASQSATQHQLQQLHPNQPASSSSPRLPLTSFFCLTRAGAPSYSTGSSASPRFTVSAGNSSRLLYSMCAYGTPRRFRPFTHRRLSNISCSSAAASPQLPADPAAA